MDEFYQLVMRIKPRPQLYVGERSLAYIFHFLNGYGFCKSMSDPDFGTWLFRDFREYLAKKFMDTRTFNWLSLIQAYCPQEDDEIDFFYDNLDEFLKQYAWAH